MNSETGNIELHIEELVLHGFAPTDRHRIAEALQSELARLLQEQGVPASFHHNVEIDRIDGGSFSAQRAANSASTPPETIGVQAAQSLYRSVQE